MWFKVDDQLATHPKAMRAGLAAMGLWVRAGSWSAQHGTDGRIPAYALSALGSTQKHADSLVKAGLWTTDTDGWQFSDWLDYQPAASDVRAEQESKANSGRRGNHNRWHRMRSRFNPDCPWCVFESEQTTKE